MKSILKITAFLMVVMLAIPISMACTGPNCTASTGTTSSDLPTKDEVNSAIMAAKVANSGNFAENFFSSIKTNHSTWHTDLWTLGSQEVVSVYYSVSLGSYGAYYLDETGNQITPASGLALKEKYMGDGLGSKTVTTTSGTCTGPNCSQSSVTNSSSVISCPTCGTGTTNTTGGLTSTITPTTSSSSTITLSSSNNSSLTADDKAKLDAFMVYINTTQQLTRDGIREQAIKCFFNGGE